MALPGDPSREVLRVVAYQLARPFAFPRIHHRHMAIYTLLLPIAITVVGVAVFYLLPVRPGLFGAGGLVPSVLSVMGNLPGFFIAALAAVATFSKDSMDHELPDEGAPRLWMMSGLDGEYVKLTRRVFLCHLFAYLSATSFCVIAISLSTGAVAPSIVSAMSGIAFGVVAIAVAKGLFLFVFLFLLATILIISLYGMYYLVERMHQSV